MLFPHLIKNDSELFIKLILKDLTKENVSLICLFLEKNPKLIDILINNLEKINLTKSSLAILDVLVKNKVKIDELKSIYEKFEGMLSKNLEKPQKAGKYFEIHQTSVGEFIKMFLKPEIATTFISKVNKYDVIDPFLGYLLNIIYQIAFKCDENNRVLSNSLLTLINLLCNVFKKDQDLLKLDENVANFNNFLNFLIQNKKVINTQQVLNNNLKSLIKFLLKFGLLNRPKLLNLLNNLIQLVEFPKEDLNNVMEMLTSHSEFMDLIILEGKNTQKCETKLELLKILLRLFQKNENLIEPNFVPLILSSYEATKSESDQILLAILKIFEEHPQRSNFYEYKPFLWGKAAANHYSIKSNVETSLFRQPKISTILDLLEIEIVLNTIKYNETPSNNLSPRKTIYDLNFFLPLFSNLLLPENPIQLYRFTKSGALALTILGLSSQDAHQRGSSCYVLSLFYTHLDAKRSKKDNLIWIRFVEAICKGISALTDDLNSDFELNNFVSVFLSRMALILTNPQHVMYPPLSQYLTAKSVLDFKLIPELLTFLHSPDVNYKEHKKFILQVIFDGLKTKRDFKAALNSISFKLILESFNSCLFDRECKLYVIKIVEKACKLDVGTKLLCENYGLFSWMYNYVENFGKENDFISIILDILSHIISFKEDYSQINEILICFINILNSFNEENTIKLLKILCSLNKFRLKENMLRHVFNVLNNKECLYYLNHLQTIHLGDDHIENVDFYLKLLTSKWILSK
nr:uncharacterized protein LOC111427518 [Onthophagus taurus]